VVVVKRDCPTCALVVPVLHELRSRTGRLTVVTQDDPAFPEGLDPVDDTELALSWRHGIETVPTLLSVRDGREIDRTEGWDRSRWEDLTGLDGLAIGLPDWRPGCGSRSVDPDLVDELRARHSASVLRSRRVELAEAEDEFEAMYARGWSDGLPLVPPTPERVEAHAGRDQSRPPAEVVAVMPPDLVDCTVEKVAINAVMAGCRPEYLPVVLAAWRPLPPILQHPRCRRHHFHVDRWWW
jgi:hypothetical protein